MSKKTKILAVGDIHGDAGLVKRLAERAVKENVDLVILAGDLTFADQSTKNLVGPFIKAKKQVLLIHGNHEGIATTDFLSEMYPDTKNIHGYSLVVNDVGIFGAGGADFGVDPMTEKTFKKVIGKAHSKIKDIDKKILVTHMHPQGSKSEFSGFKGSKSIREAIDKYQPDFAIFSHIHEAAGLEENMGKTKVINVSRKEKIFEI
ncbi:metallophosphoesterase [Candidatus Pacearchaeota archaeon]|jgi:Icc-related predicted phosphoesterase|nr:metallophosphoesterase [Candidatus Pacearchaeota archaeon]